MNPPSKPKKEKKFKVKAWILKYNLEKGKIPPDILLHDKEPSDNTTFKHYISCEITYKLTN